MKIMTFIKDYDVLDSTTSHKNLHFNTEKPSPLSEHLLLSSFTTKMNTEEIIIDGL